MKKFAYTVDLYTVYLYICSAMKKEQKEQTKVISFRLPVAEAEKIDRQARKEKRNRAELVGALFSRAFENHVGDAQKQAA